MTTRVLTVGVLSLREVGDVGSLLRLREKTIEQIVLAFLEPVDLLDEVGPVAVHGVGVALGVLVLTVGDRSLGHQRPEPGVVRGLRQVAELLLGHGQLLAELAQACAQLRQTSLDEGP